ncbi:MAG: dihydrofolate reductase [Pseudomonadota bacterium]
MNRPDIVLVSAVAENRVIGADGGMPWHLPDDLKHFKRLTVGKPCIMGRRTFDSMGGPLPARHNIVLTTDADWAHPPAERAANLAEAVAAAGLNPKARADAIMVIGGASVYAEALPSATRLELTEVHATPEGDTFFPDFDRARWRETRRERHDGPAGQPDFSFVTWERA